MKFKILLLVLIIYIPLVLNPECGTSSRAVSPQSGKWKIAFSYSDGSSFGNTVIEVQDDGSFCGKLKVADTGEQFFVTGEIANNVISRGGFYGYCGNFFLNDHMFNGAFSDLLGAGYASGKFSYTEHNIAYKGTWLAKRN